MKKFLKKVWNLIIKPFKWIWKECKDWRTLIIFIIVVAVVSCEVWVPYLIAFIIGLDTDAGKWLVGIGSACWLFWLGPFTPFIPLCIGITFGIKKLMQKFKGKKKERD